MAVEFVTAALVPGNARAAPAALVTETQLIATTAQLPLALPYRPYQSLPVPTGPFCPFHLPPSYPCRCLFIIILPLIPSLDSVISNVHFLPLEYPTSVLTTTRISRLLGWR